MHVFQLNQLNCAYMSGSVKSKWVPRFPLHEKSHDANLNEIFDIFMVLFFHVFLVVYYTRGLDLMSLMSMQFSTYQ